MTSVPSGVSLIPVELGPHFTEDPSPPCLIPGLCSSPAPTLLNGIKPGQGCSSLGMGN